MKYNLTVLFLIATLSVMYGQDDDQSKDILITSERGKTKVTEAADGTLTVNVSPKKVERYKKKGLVTYRDFGAKGNGKKDDINAIAAAHAFANQYELPVKLEKMATYYIGGRERTAIIQTNTDFGEAEFIIDDKNVENRNAPVFMVQTQQKAFIPEGLHSLKRDQEKVDLTFPATCLITVTNDNVRRYIRFGPNQNDGRPQTDIFIVNKQGEVDMDAPIVWDFDKITEISALPIDEDQLTIRGGRFTTIANQAESKYTYYRRGMAIRRSNVLVENLEHQVTGEGDTPPSPSTTVKVHYSGWLTDGKKFDSSYDRNAPIDFPLNRVIGGWTEGVGSMKVGSTRWLVIPPDLGYGARGAGGSIPPNAVLVFKVELLDLVK